MLLLDIAVSNATLETIALVLGIIALLIWILGWLFGRPWRRG